MKDNFEKLARGSPPCLLGAILNDDAFSSKVPCTVRQEGEVAQHRANAGRLQLRSVSYLFI